VCKPRMRACMYHMCVHMHIQKNASTMCWADSPHNYAEPLVSFECDGLTVPSIASNRAALARTRGVLESAVSEHDATNTVLEIVFRVVVHDPLIK
jgi:hypothetical protein